MNPSSNNDKYKSKEMSFCCKNIKVYFICLPSTKELYDLKHLKRI